MININAVFQEIIPGATQIIKQAAGQSAAQATKDVNAFIDRAKPLIAEWVQQLNDGKISKDDFEFLAAGRLKGVMQLAALTETGIAAAKLDIARSQIVSLVIKVILTCVPL